MVGDLDKVLNRQLGFKHVTIEPAEEVRLLSLSRQEGEHSYQFNLKVVAAQDLPSIDYTALSYTWGQAQSLAHLQEVKIDGQTFHVRQNLFAFLERVTRRGEAGLYFIDAICINQLNDSERQAQVQCMAHIYRNASRVVAWLGAVPEEQQEGLRELAEGQNTNSKGWSRAQWEAFRYLSYHHYWSRVWIVQEVLLASRTSVLCGQFTFPLRLFGSPTYMMPETRASFDNNGTPTTTVSASWRLRSPAELVITHRARHVMRHPCDDLVLCTEVATLGEMVDALMKHTPQVRTYQTRLPDLFTQVLRKFGKLSCTDPRDKLYGFLGILSEHTRAKITPDYTQDVRAVFKQALKIGLEELQQEHHRELFPSREYEGKEFLVYYCDVRDAFHMSENKGREILRQVIRELAQEVNTRVRKNENELWPELNWQHTELDMVPGFRQLLEDDEEKESNFPRLAADPGPLLRFHQFEHRSAHTINNFIQCHFGTRRRWKRL